MIPFIDYRVQRYSCIFLFIIALTHGTYGVVRINEISARSTDRLLDWSDGIAKQAHGIPWYESAFDDSTWSSGSSPIGAGYGDLGTNLSGQDVDELYSLYLRQTIVVTGAQATSSSTLQVNIDYDDGFILFINGAEMARHNLGPANMYIHHDHSAFNTRSGGSAIAINLGPASSFLLSGNNVIAVQIQKDEPDDNVRLEMNLKVGTQTILNNASNWNYFLGFVEPYGGIYDEALFGNSSYESDYEDWIELYNSGPGSVSLANWAISDGGVPWTFPADASIADGEYLVIFADGLNLTTEGDFYHTDFKLSESGESITLSDDQGTVVSQWLDYPDQSSFHSYGVSPTNGTLVYFARPTPQALNAGEELLGITKPGKFSHAGGFYDTGFSLTLYSNTAGASIRYTTDGTEPTEATGTLYTAPIAITAINDTTATVVRTRAFSAGMIPSKIKTRTFLVGQHAMIKHLPVMSIVADGPRALFEPFGVAVVEGGHHPGGGKDPPWQVLSVNDYNMPIEHGRSVERSISMEVRFNDQRDGFQIDAGIRIGGSSHARPRYLFDDLDRSPWNHREWRNKPSFNLYFRGDYGESILDNADLFPYSHVTEAETFRLRAGRNKPALTPFIRDELVRRLYINMGHLGSTGSFVNLFVNGEYKGYYNPTQLIKEPFLQELHQTSNPFDVWQNTAWQHGNSTVYNDLKSRLSQDLSVQANFEAVEELLDIDAVADYYLLQLYTTAFDWPNKNYVFARERALGCKFSFYPWDNEASFGSSWVDDDWIAKKLLNNSDSRPCVYIWHKLVNVDAFQIRFADRVYKQFFAPGGGLTDANIQARIDDLKALIGPVIPFVTPGEQFNDNLFNTFLNERKDYIFDDDHFSTYGLWPELEVPVFSQHGGVVVTNYTLTLATPNPQSGTYYYTLDGSDPRTFSGGVSGSALTYNAGSPPQLTASSTVITRILHNGEWSARNEADFIVGTLASNTNLVVTEIMYHPTDPTTSEINAGFTDDDLFEFIELMNIGADTIVLDNVRFTSGISFDFVNSTITSLAPEEKLLLVANSAAFEHRYGSGHPVAGEFLNKLSNGGEQLEILGYNDAIIQDFVYDDGAPWPVDADGAGYSLVLDDPDSNPVMDDPGNWRPSSNVDGDPGTIESTFITSWKSNQFTPSELSDPSVSGDDADPDGDGLNNLLEFALVSDPKDKSNGSLFSADIQLFNVNASIDNYQTLSYRFRPGAQTLTYQVEITNDFTTWTSVGETTTVSTLNNGDGSMTRTVRRVTQYNDQAQYIRLRVIDNSP